MIAKTVIDVEYCRNAHAVNVFSGEVLSIPEMPKRLHKVENSFTQNYSAVIIFYGYIFLYSILLIS